MQAVFRGPHSFAKQIDKFAKQSKVLTVSILRRGAVRFRQRMLNENLAGRPGLNRRSGNLARSLTVWVDPQIKSPRLFAKIGGRMIPYAAIQEYGGIITPKRARMLAIPLPPVCDSRGTPIFKSPRHQPGLFIIRSRRGNLLLVRRVGKRIEPQWVLRHVTGVPARMGFHRTFEIECKHTLAELRREFKALGRKRVG